jgi:hypothetical protein
MSTITEPLPRASQPNESLNKPTESFFEDPLAIRTMLVATDFSDASFGALDFALLLAKRFGAAVHVIYIHEDKPCFGSFVKTS